MNRLVCRSLIAMFSTFGTLSAEMLNFPSSSSNVEYTITDDFSGSMTVDGEKISVQGRTTNKFLLKLVSSDKVEVTPISYFLNSVSKNGRKRLAKWRYDSVKKKASPDLPEAIKATFQAMEGKTILFEKSASGDYVEAPGQFDNLEPSAQMMDTGWNSIRGIREFVTQALTFAGSEIQTGKQELPLRDELNNLQDVKFSKAATIYNVKKDAQDNYFAYIRSQISGSHQSGALTDVKIRGKVNWDSKNALVQQRKNIIKAVGKERDNRFVVRTKDVWTSRVLEATSQ